MAKWYYAKNNERLGPISTTELKALAQIREVDGNTLVWRDGFESWVEARTIKGLFSGEEASAPSNLDDSPAQYLPPDAIEPPIVEDLGGESKSTPSFDQVKLRQTGSKLLASAKAFGSAAGDAAKASLIQAEITKISTITLPRAYTRLGEAIHDKDYVREHWPELTQRITEVITKIASLKPDEKKDKQQTSFVEKAKSLATAAKAQGHKSILERQLKKHFSELGKLAFDHGKVVDVSEELLQVIRVNLQKLDSLRSSLKVQTSAMKAQGGKSYSGLISAAKSYPKVSLAVGGGFVLLFAGFLMMWNFPNKDRASQSQQIRQQNDRKVEIVETSSAPVETTVVSIPNLEQPAGSRSLQVIVNTSLSDQAWGRKCNLSLKDVCCYATDDQLIIDFDVDTSLWFERSMAFLVRLADRNGNILTFFTTEEDFTIIPYVFSIRQARYEAAIRNGMPEQNAAELKCKLLQAKNNRLVYSVNVRDLRDAAAVEIGFVDK